jgi:hypothetical protein
MRAVAITAPGGPEVLTVVERDVRAPGPGEVRLAVRAAAVWVRTVLERTDWLELLRDRAASSRLALRVAAEHPPGDAARAHEIMAAGGLRGRGVIVF